MGAKNLPASGFPQQQQRDNRPQRQAPNKATLKNIYGDQTPVLTAIPSTFWGTPVYKDSKGVKHCPGFIGEAFSKNPWDYVTIEFPNSGVPNQTPGLCTVSVRRGRKVDRKKSSGSDGETLTFTGISNADIEISITIWTPEQLDILIDLWKVIQPPPGKGVPQAFDIKHPQFLINQVKSCVFVDSIGLENGSVSKTKTFVIKAVEYLPASKRKTTKTPDRAKARGSKLDAADENTQPGKNPHAVGPR